MTDASTGPGAEGNDGSFDSLNSKVDDLIALCVKIKRENQALRASEINWQAERRQLLARSREAKARLKSILARLKAMDDA